MQNRDETIVENAAHPLKSLTAAQFMALGGSAVAYVRSVKGAVLSEMLSQEGFDFDADYQLVMSADGTPLMVADTQDAVQDWLSERNLGVVALH